MFLHLATSRLPQDLMSVTATMELSSQTGTTSAVLATATASVDIVKQGNRRGIFGRRGGIGLISRNPTDEPPIPIDGWTSALLTPPVIGGAEAEYRDLQPESLPGLMTAVPALSPPLRTRSLRETGPELTSQPIAKTAPVVASRPLHVLFPTSQDLLIFDRSADAALKQRFNDILDRLEEPLLRHVYKQKEQCQPISIRFGYLGVSEPEAQPSIIVFCSEKKGKKVWKFFKKSLAKELCQPSNNEFPTLAVYVVGARPCPRLRTINADVHIATPYGPAEETYCGAPIRMVSDMPSIHRCATLGGMIKTRTNDSEFKLLAMTAGHVLDTWRDDGQNSNTESESESESDSGSEPAGAGGAEDDATRDVLPWSSGEHTQVATSIVTPIPECDGPSRGRYYDWAVFGVDKAKRNLLPGRSPGGKLARDLIMPLEETSPGPARPRSVAMLNASSSMPQGLLTDGPSRLLLRPGKSLIRTLILTLGEGSSTFLQPSVC